MSDSSTLLQNPPSEASTSACAGAHSHEMGHACTKPDTPCGIPCDTPCDQHFEAQEKASVFGLDEKLLHGLNTSFFNALDLCFDEVYKEPKTILMLGGCRQRDFARYVALLLPQADITLLDPDPKEAASAKEDICCRFQFLSAEDLTQLPFDKGQFDLVIAHNLPEFASDNAEAVLAELRRVTSEDQGNLWVSRHRPLLWGLTRWLPGMAKAVKKTGVSLDCPKVAGSTIVRDTAWFESVLNRLAPVSFKVAPYPWQLYVLNT